MADFSRLIDEGVTLRTLRARLDGMTAGYLGAYEFCDNYDRLDSILNMSKQEVLERIYTAIGIVTEKLTEEQRRFLELSS